MASYPEFSFVFGRLFWELLPLLVFFIIDDVSFLNLPDITAFAIHNSRNIWELGDVLDLIEIISHDFFDFKIFDLFVASFLRAVHLFKFDVISICKAD